MSQRCDSLLVNTTLATLVGEDRPWGVVEDAMLAIDGGRILYAGSAGNAPDLAAAEVVDGRGQWATPALIDCHTHLVYAGNRAREFEQRLQGASYETIARSGGGILSTVAQTRAASEDTLYEQARSRLARLLEEGVATVEIKSGYGLELDTELRMLRVARRLGEALPVTVRTTFLGAHALPEEFREQGAYAYIDHVCRDILPEVARQGLADAVDVFCEGVGFNPDQCEQVFVAALGLGLPIKAHAEQLSNLRGARLAAQHGALSVDHLEYLQPSDAVALAEAGTVAVLLPGAFYFLGESRKPPVDALREQGVPVAVATDLNPGSSPMASLLLAMNQASILFGLTPEESLRGATRNAALALGLENKGLLQAGRDADIALWDIQHPAQLVCEVNQHRPTRVWQGGRCVRSA
jgi:imidazolonepropionase